MDATTTPTGAWDPLYADRISAMAELPELAFDDPRMVAAMAERDRPFGHPEPTDAVAEERAIPGPHGPVRVRVYRPAAGEVSGAGLVWCHGGAFVAGDLDMPEADLVARGLVTRTRGVVVSVDYRLCHDGVCHPVPHDDVHAAYRWVRDHATELGIDPELLAIGGSSAGGNLAASAALHARDDGVPPAQALLMYPVLHPLVPPPSPELVACLARTPTPMRFPEPVQRWMAENFLGGPVTDADSYAFVALADDLGGYPSTYLENAEFDDLRSSGEDFARRLTDAGVDVELVTAAGVPHGHLNAIGSPLTHASLDRLAGRLLHHRPPSHARRNDQEER